jgi:antitoxin (DNA-binding transcriptional repressor) of toxin-antitoxin stability system
MTTGLFQQIEAVSEGDEVRITLATEDPDVRGFDFDQPIVTRVTAVDEETVDARQKNVDVEGIVDRRVLQLAPLPADDRHEVYVIETRSPVVGDETVTPLRARRRQGSSPSNGQDTFTEVGRIEAVEVLS